MVGGWGGGEDGVHDLARGSVIAEFTAYFPRVDAYAKYSRASESLRDKAYKTNQYEAKAITC